MRKQNLEILVLEVAQTYEGTLRIFFPASNTMAPHVGFASGALGLGLAATSDLGIISHHHHETVELVT